MAVRYRTLGPFSATKSNESELVEVGNRRFLLKRYRFPNATDQSWFAEYLAYSRTLNRRIARLGALVVPASRVFEEHGRVAMLVPLLEGQSLDSAALAAEDRWFQAAVVCYAVVRLHQAGVVHGDLKPSNVLVVQGRPRLLDFDFSFGVLDLPPWAAHEGVYLGTEAYSSPEQKAGMRPGMASDVYSLGLVLKVLLGWECAASLHEKPDLRVTAPEVFCRVVEACPYPGLKRRLARTVPRCLSCLASDPWRTKQRNAWDELQQELGALDAPASSALRARLSLAAKAGIAEAQFRLGVNRRSRVWLERAAAQGYPPALEALGSYRMKLSRPKALRRAVAFWNEAAYRGSRLACDRLVAYWESQPETAANYARIDRYTALRQTTPAGPFDSGATLN